VTAWRDTDLGAQLAGHLELLTDLGIDGISRDPAWRSRGGRDEARPSGRDEAVPAASGDAGAAGASGTPPLEPGAGPESLERIRAGLGECARCKLHALGRRQIVFGVGNPRARLMFIGEAPGRDEDLQGIPFVGRAGQLLTKMIEAIGLAREEVYIANVIKCRPPENRNPEPDEVASCRPFLFRQVEAIGPAVIVALGKFAAQALLDTEDPISRLRGRVYLCHGAKLVPTFHPAYLLRSPDQKKEAWKDLKVARGLLDADPSGGASQG
jgi:DNA polymerase